MNNFLYPEEIQKQATEKALHLKVHFSNYSVLLDLINLGEEISKEVGGEKREKFKRIVRNLKETISICRL